MTTMGTAVAARLAFLAAVLVSVLVVTACTAGSGPGPLASHGVDYIPAFDNPYGGGGGRGG